MASESWSHESHCQSILECIVGGATGIRIESVAGFGFKASGFREQDELVSGNWSVVLFYYAGFRGFCWLVVLSGLCLERSWRRQKVISVLRRFQNEPFLSSLIGS